VRFPERRWRLKPAAAARTGAGWCENERCCWFAHDGAGLRLTSENGDGYVGLVMLLAAGTLVESTQIIENQEQLKKKKT